MGKINNIFRIKLNGRSVIKLSKVKSERDYIFSIPSLVQDSVEVNTHFTFHTPNNRLTFKTTTAKQNSVDIMSEILDKIKDHEIYKNKVTRDKVTGKVKDLDFYGDNGGRILNLSFNIIERIPSISFNLKGLDWNKFFNIKQKTSDNEFIYTPLNLSINESTAEGFTLHIYIGKDYIADFTELTSKYEGNFVVTDRNINGSTYLFLFLYNFVFTEPKDTPSDKSITLKGNGQTSYPI